MLKSKVLDSMAKVHPHYITTLALTFGVLVPVFAKHTVFALCFLLISGLFDILDGSVARAFGKTSKVGAALDITSDRIVEFAIILGLFLINPEERGLYCLLMLGSVLICITTFLVVGIFSQNESEKSFHYSPGLIERKEAFAFFTLMFLSPSLFSFLALTFSALVCLTGLVRIRAFIAHSS